MPLPWIIGGLVVAGIAAVTTAALSDDDSSSGGHHQNDSDKQEKKAKLRERKKQLENKLTSKNSEATSLKDEYKRLIKESLEAAFDVSEPCYSVQELNLQDQKLNSLLKDIQQEFNIELRPKTNLKNYINTEVLIKKIITNVNRHI